MKERICQFCETDHSPGSFDRCIAALLCRVKALEKTHDPGRGVDVWLAHLVNGQEQMQGKLTEILNILRKDECPPARSELRLSVTEVHGRRCMMAIERPPLVLFDTDKCLISLKEEAKGPFTWSSSDPAQVAVEPQGDGRTCYVLTPGDTGEATITVKAKGYQDQTMLVTYSDSTPGELGMSAGTPEPD